MSLLLGRRPLGHWVGAPHKQRNRSRTHGTDNGCLKVLVHDAVVNQLAQAIEDIGAAVRTEALIPEFTPTATRRMDIWAYGVPGCQDLLVDVTVRSEMAKYHGAPVAPTTTELWQQWADTQERHKLVDYPDAGGRHCTPFVIGSWGRISPAGEALLVHLPGRCG